MLHYSLKLNYSVHGEFRFSSLAMPPPSDASKTGGRLSGEDMCEYMEMFANTYLKDKIKFRTEIIGIRRSSPEGPWLISVQDKETGASEVLEYSRIVLCTGVSSPKGI